MTTFVNLAALLALLTVHTVNFKAQVDAATRSGMPGMSQPLPMMGSNADGGSVFDNYDKLVEEGQFFLLWEAINQKEEPDQEVVLEFTMVYWCADFNYPKVDETDPVIGYTGACVEHFLRGDSYSGEHVTDGKNHTLTAEEATSAYMLSSVYVSQSNLMEGQMHESTDNWVKRFWDNGMKSMPGLGWETHDEGDTAPNAYKINWSGVGKFSWISVEEAADLLGKERTSLHSLLPTRTFGSLATVLRWQVSVGRGENLKKCLLMTSNATLVNSHQASAETVSGNPMDDKSRKIHK